MVPWFIKIPGLVMIGGAVLLLISFIVNTLTGSKLARILGIISYIIMAISIIIIMVSTVVAGTITL